ncbi:MAG: A/G-specific adenine glycosylase [Flavobacteriales bacterium]|nr:A/G-specific adenine glycosylase [Flavobacteriales bacterium]
MSTAWFSRALLPWYREHKRPLPWRDQRDPYPIWLSEVILQQTRVDQGMAYWHRFVQRYPTVKELAEAPEDKILRLWQGLGYYSRARNLRTAARQVVEQHGGEFPASFEALRGLKGVGDYTAAAIGSIAFGLVEPVVDGNVYRVLARVFGIATPIDSTAGRKEFRGLAAALMDHTHPGDHNQAVMELGAIVCTPKDPRCGQCPVAARCIARKEGRIAGLPVKAGRTKVRERHFNYLHIGAKGSLYLQKRTGKDIWHGLYELPLIESDKAATPKRLAALLEERFGPGWVIVKKHDPVKHVLSHQVIHALFWEVQPPKGFKVPKEWIKVSVKELDGYAVPRLMERYLEVGRA